MNEKTMISILKHENAYNAIKRLKGFEPMDWHFELFERTVFRDRNKPLEYRKFPVSLEMVLSSRYFAKDIEYDMGIIDRTYIIRIYKTDHESGAYVTTCEILTGTIHNDSWGMKYKPEYVTDMSRYIPNTEDDWGFVQFAKKLEFEVNRDPNEPLYYVKYCSDPRIVGDYASEVYDEVAMIDYRDVCLEFYRGTRNGGLGGGRTPQYYTYPCEVTEPMKVGDKNVIHAARELTYEDWAEIDAGY